MNKEKRAYSVKCLICGKDICDCYGESHISIKCATCKTRFTIDEDLKTTVCECIYDEYPAFESKKVVGYAPIFRKGKDISAEISAMAKCFDKEEYVFMLKKHPLMSVASIDDGFTGVIDEKFTTIEMMYAVDYVICDYPAVVYEAAVMGKPLFFYTFDYESYGVDRDFYIYYMSEMPGVISGDAKVIAEAVKNGDYDLDRVKGFGRRYVEQQERCANDFTGFIKKIIQARI